LRESASRRKSRRNLPGSAAELPKLSHSCRSRTSASAAQPKYVFAPILPSSFDRPLRRRLAGTLKLVAVGHVSELSGCPVQLQSEALRSIRHRAHKSPPDN
jgi:hypothetical protein